MDKYTCRRKKYNGLEGAEGIGSFGLAEMEFPLDEKVQNEIIEYMKVSVMGYSQAPDSYYETIGNWMRKYYNEKVENEHIVITSGVIPAIKSFIKLKTKPNDHVLIFTPAYNNFYTAIQDTDRVVEEVELVYDTGSYSIDFDLLEQVLAKDLVKMMIICNPHNPIGRILTKEELKKIIKLCKTHNVFVISDEIHADLIFTGAEFNSLLDFDFSIPVCTSGSKTFNIAGFKTSNIIITDDNLRVEFNNYINTNNLVGNSALGLFGTEKSYELSEGWLTDKLDIIQENIQIVNDSLKNTKVIISEQDSTYLMWLDFNEYVKADPNFFDLLKENGIYFSEGTLYGAAGAGFARVNVATDTQCVIRMLEILLPILNKTI